MNGVAKRVILLSIGLFMMSSSVMAQYYSRTRTPVVQPKAARWEFYFKNIVLDYSIEEEKSYSSADDEHLYRSVESFSPMIGGGISGSLYHPNLFSFTVEGVEGITKDDVKTEPSGVATERPEGKSSSEMGYISAEASLFQHKPYGLRYHYNRTSTLRNYDFFSRVRVHTTRHDIYWGVNLDPLVVTVSFNKWREHIEELTRPTWRDESSLETRMAYTPSTYNATRIKHTIEDFTSLQEGSDLLTGTRNVFNFENTLRPYGSEIISMRTSADAYILDSVSGDSEQYSVGESIRVHHARSLDGSYSGRVSRNENDGASNDRFHILGSLSHKLYESLYSSIQVGLHNSEMTDEFGDLVWKNNSFSRGFSESYNKKLPAGARLNLSFGWDVTSTDHESGQTSVNVFDERHRLLNGEKTFLNLLNAEQQSVVVADISGKIIYLEGLDYRVINHGQSLEIERVIAGTIRNGAEVLVDYTAQGTGSEKYESFNRNAAASLSFLDGRVRTYVRSIENESDGTTGSLTFEDISSKIIGAELSGPSFKMGVERQDVGSSYIPYNSVRFFQDYYMNAGKRTQATLSMSQLMADYHELDQNERVYSSVLTCNSQITYDLRASFSVGLYDERGRGIERNYEVYRGGLNWRLGMARVAMTFHYSDSRDDDSIREKKSFSIRFERAL